MRKCRIIVIINQKGGVGKTVTTFNLAVGMAMKGLRVLVIDMDPQGHLTVAMGWRNKDDLTMTITQHLERAIADNLVDPMDGILNHDEGIDLMPANRKLSDTEVKLMNALYREAKLKMYLDTVIATGTYDCILIDSPASLSVLTTNALTAADSVIIPTQTEFLSANGIADTMGIINAVRRQLNPSLTVSGILLTMVNKRTNLSRETEKSLRQAYDGIAKIYDAYIPRANSLADCTTCGMSIYEWDHKSVAAKAYGAFVNEVLADEAQG